jgi:hypothetical protein
VRSPSLPQSSRGGAPCRVRCLLLASVVLASACVTQQASTAWQATSVEQRMHITNQPPYDVAICHARGRALPQPANQGILSGAVVSTMPQVMECLVAPGSRGPEKTTRVLVRTHVTEEGGTHALAGENLTPEGQACVQGVVDTRVALVPLPRGTRPVESEASFVHDTSNNATVTFGINEGSDFSGAVRLAQASWCECYADFTHEAPPLLTAHVGLKKGRATPAEISFEPAGTPEGDRLAACLRERMMALPVALRAEELKFSYRFVHFHSRATEPTTGLPPELRFFQLELMRGQRAADSALAFGARANAAEVFQAAADRYKRSISRRQPDGDQMLLAELGAKCNGLVDSVRQWVKSLDAQLQLVQATLANVQELVARDAVWAEVEAKARADVHDTRQDLTAARQRLQADMDACPKTSY